jgi:hypothetical protein
MCSFLFQQPETATLVEARGLLLVYCAGVVLLGILAGVIHYVLLPRLGWAWPQRRDVAMQFAAGIAWAVLLQVVVVGANALLGSYSPASPGFGFFHHVMQGNDAPTAWMVWLFFTMQGTTEELLFRGVGLALLASLLAWAATLVRGSGASDGSSNIDARALWFWSGLGANVVIAGAFSSVHSHNPAVTPASLANIALAGFALGQLYWLHGRLWGACAMHIWWNAGLASLGLPVSGITVREPLLGNIRGSVPGVWSGGDFGPEASALSAVVLALIGAWLVWCCWRRAAAEPFASAAPQS